jgi:protocatechuate 3,4-dioxygenase beta subunit
MTLAALAIALVMAASGAASAQAPCRPTPRDMEGPFYKPGAPVRESTGRGFVVSGAVRSAATCQPIPGARVEWWQAGPDGRYDDGHRGTQVVGEAGTYRFETDFPPPYGGRPSHVHLKAWAPGHRPLTTQLYPRAGQSQAAFDLVLVKE